MRADLGSFPRVELAPLPTPLEDCPRLTEHLGGPPILIKRDDATLAGAGGNKVRKLEYLLGKARADGADTVITFGAVQTNHGRQTAAACARLGLRCQLVLTDLVPRSDDAYLHSGNILLDTVFGAEVHVCPGEDETVETFKRLMTDADEDGRTVAVLPLGGSDAVGVLGYANAAAELTGQLAERGMSASELVVPCSSGGTVAGLVLGTALLGSDLRINAACVSHSASETEQTVAKLLADTADMLGVHTPSLDRVRFDDSVLGAGYGIPDERVWRAIRFIGITTGIPLDPVYSGKAAALLMDVVSESRDAGSVVFLHTGGMPGLFGYGPEAYAELAGMTNTMS
ncbi:D-cysteine desulfhydrase family protein [Haloechinothrix salitolerans]|uniref:D-cysteine desulfhydrase family protein n=1 Tax=Haloechinothrix salitolerans TaxID=926830 RepID=A0ABW2C9Z0_9PSEU